MPLYFTFILLLFFFFQLIGQGKRCVAYIRDIHSFFFYFYRVSIAGGGSSR